MNQEYLNKMRDIQERLIELIENQYSNNEDCQTLIHYIHNQKIHENHLELKAVLHLISKISNSHYRTTGFFDKIEQILKFFEKEIQQNFTNSQIFNIFKNNKRILLFLFTEKILQPNRSIALIITDEKHRNMNYPTYFYPEFKEIFDELLRTNKNKYKQIEESIKNVSKELPIDETKRKIGENDSIICEIIRKDSMNEFISFINRNNYLVTGNVSKSIYETHSYLMKKSLTLIEYAAFFGAVQIMKYLYHQTIILSPSLWIHAVHGMSSELIHLLEENKIRPSDDIYQQCYLDAVKCHHNEFANYIENNYLPVNNEFYEDVVLGQSINYYNFSFINDDAKISSDIFYFLCKSDNYLLVADSLKKPDFDLNLKKISSYFVCFISFLTKNICCFMKFLILFLNRVLIVFLLNKITKKYLCFK